MVSLETRRYYDSKKRGYTGRLVDSGRAGGYREFEGIRIPAISTVTWKLKEGDYTWLKLELTEVNYNKIE